VNKLSALYSRAYELHFLDVDSTRASGKSTDALIEVDVVRAEAVSLRSRALRRGRRTTAR
jgi:hypothetical protein